MTRVLVTGPESSGTGAVAEAIRRAGAEVVHLAVPHVHDWFAPFAEVRYVDRAVVVLRGALAHAASLIDHSGELHDSHATPAEHRAKAIFMLSTLPARLDPIWVTYESLFHAFEMAALLRHLGLPFEGACPLEDRNRARYEAMEAPDFEERARALTTAMVRG